MMPLRRHDRYVLRAYWTTFLAVLLFFTLVVVAMDATERIRKLTRNWDQVAARGQHPLLVLGEYYVTLIPFLWMKLLAFCAPAAAVFCLARLMRHNELLPLITGGVSPRRVARPIAISGLVIAGSMLLLQETVIPSLNRRHMRLSRIVLRNSPDRVTQVPHFHDRRGGRLAMGAYLPLQQRMEAVSITFYEPQSGAPREQVWYPELAWDAAADGWRAPSGGQKIPLRDPNQPGIVREPIAADSIAPIDGSAAFIELSLLAKLSAGLSYGQMTKLAEANPDSPSLTVLKHELITAPLSVLILTLLSLPFSLRVARRTKSAIPGVVGMMAIAGLYFGAQILAGSIARGGELNPVVLAWLPTVLFGSIALTAYWTLDG